MAKPTNDQEMETPQEEAMEAKPKPYKLKAADKPKLAAKLGRWWEEDSSARKRTDWQWFLYDLWREGHHYARYDKNTQQVVTTPQEKGKPKVMVNKIDPAVRAVVNYALRNRPKAEVTPADASQDALDEIAKQNLFLNYLHDRLDLRTVERGAVDESVTSGLSWVQVLWDEAAADGKGEVAVHEVDKYDLYWSARARDPKESRRYTLAVSRPIELLKTDPKYKGADWDKVKADNARSSSALKERLLNLDTGSDVSTGSSEDKGSVLLKEFWYYGDKELGEDPEKIYVCAMAGDEIIRTPEETDLTRMPFFRLCVARKKLSMVGRSWIKNLIPLNKRLNHLMSSMAEYNVVMNKGYWVADKGSGVRTIKNEHGLILEKKRGTELKQYPVPGLSSVLMNEIEYILQMFEDISAVHDATMGRIPTGAKSGKALEALQTGDSNNLAEVVENTELWLEEVYEYILTLAAQKYQFARDITPMTSTGQRQFLKVVGEDAQSEQEAQGQDVDPMMQKERLVIKKKNVVDVKITSYLAHTAEARREAIRELATLIPDLDPQTILEVYEVGPIADIIMRIKEREAERQQQEIQTARAQQGVQLEGQAAQQEMQASQQPEGAGADAAIAAIRMIVDGNPDTVPEIPEIVSPEFVQYFDSFIQNPPEGLDPAMLTLLQKVRDDVATRVGQPQPQAKPGK